MQKFTPMFKLLYCEQPPWLRRTAPCTKSGASVWSPTGELEVVTSQMVSFSSAAVQKPTHCLIFAEVHPHKNKWQNFCFSLWQFKIKRFKNIFTFIFPEPMKGVFDHLQCSHPLPFQSMHSLCFAGNESNYCLKDWELKSLEAELRGLCPDHSILPHVSIGHGVTGAVQKPMGCMLHWDQPVNSVATPWGAHNWRDVIHFLPLWIF